MQRLLLLPLLLVLSIPVTSCAPKAPPNLYPATVQAKYEVTPLKRGILALSQTAIAMNKATGPTHLSDANTVLVRDFALQASQSLDDYVGGKSTLSNVVSSFRKLLTQLTADVQSSALRTDLLAVQQLVDAIPLGVQ